MKIIYLVIFLLIGMNQIQGNQPELLNPLELLEWSIGNGNPFNIVIEVEGNGKVDHQKLYQSALTMFNSHSQLQKQVTSYEGEFYFNRVSQSRLPIYVVEDYSVKTALNSTFDRNSYLWNLILVEKENGFSLYLRLHHVLGDGISAMELMKELLSHYEDSLILIESNDSVTWYNRLQGVKHVEEASRFADKCGTKEVLLGGTNVLSFTLDHASQFTKLCKEKGVRVQAFLLALMLKAVDQTSLTKSFPSDVLSHHLVNMRSHVEPPVPNNTLRCVISQLEFPVERSVERTFWEEAKHYSEMIDQMLKNGEAEKTLEEVGNLLASNIDGPSFSPSVKIPTLCITNIGRSGPLDSQDLAIKNARLHVTTHSIYQAPALLLAVNTYDDNLNFQLHYPDYYISEEDISEFVETFQGIFHALF